MMAGLAFRVYFSKLTHLLRSVLFVSIAFGCLVFVSSYAHGETARVDRMRRYSSGLVAGKYILLDSVERLDFAPKDATMLLELEVGKLRVLPCKFFDVSEIYGQQHYLFISLVPVLFRGDEKSIGHIFVAQGEGQQSFVSDMLRTTWELQVRDSSPEDLTEKAMFLEAEIQKWRERMEPLVAKVADYKETLKSVLSGVSDSSSAGWDSSPLQEEERLKKLVARSREIVDSDEDIELRQSLSSELKEIVLATRSTLGRSKEHDDDYEKKLSLIQQMSSHNLDDINHQIEELMRNKEETSK